MPSPEADIAIEQVIALGRGLELNSDEYPGTVQYQSPRSGDSYDRGVTTARYSLLHPEVKRVAFSGGVSFTVPEYDRPEGSEGQGMADVAWEHWAMIPAEVDPDSGTTVENFLNCVRKGYLDPNKATGIIVDERQRKNAVWAGRLVMPHAELRVISPYDNPDLKATMPDEQLSTDPNMRPTKRDRISGALYRVAMINVTPGDIEAIARRDKMVQRNVSRALRGVRAIRGAFAGAPSTDHSQAAA